jgi:hypothetical protein
MFERRRQEPILCECRGILYPLVDMPVFAILSSEKMYGAPARVVLHFYLPESLARLFLRVYLFKNGFSVFDNAGNRGMVCR